ncbi:MAG: cupin domain-containing protein [Novosphingobium sp.]
MSTEEFIENIWARKFHHFVRSTPDFYDKLCTPEDIEAYLDSARVPVSAVRLTSVNDELPRTRFRFEDGSLDVVEIRNAFANGYSIVLNALDRYFPDIAEVSHAVEIELQFECQINAYLTPPGSQAFPVHFDDHDVFIAQLHGTKLWTIYENTVVDGTRLAQRDDIDTAGLPEPLTVTLSPGDALYIPRGMLHAAQTQDTPSVHLTFGIHPPTLKHLIVEIVEAMALRDGRLSDRLPPRLFECPGSRLQVIDMVRKAAMLLAEENSVADGLGSLQDNLVRRGRCHARGQMVENSINSHRIECTTKLVRYSPLYSRVMGTADGVALQFGQSLVNAPMGHLQAMLFVSKATGAFEVGDLPGLEAEAQLEFARTLVTSGFLSLQESLPTR